ncbi:fluoride exporter, partial [Lecanoromycetidae sp. Uapishka_2]
MPPEDENTALEAVLPPAEEERRKARLWLGYSEDNLRSSSRAAEGQYEAQTERTRPAPTGDREPPQTQEPRQPRTRSRKFDPLEPEEPHPAQIGGSQTLPKREQSRLQTQSRRPKYSKRSSSHRDSQESYTVPDDYGNLDEVAAPSPIASPQKERQEGYLEDRDIGSDSAEGNLDELAAPPPVAERQEDDNEGHLEDRDDSPSTDETKGQKQETPSRRQQVSKLATELYTISYLIFFSIIGTLARLGLQALTFYPGAPVQTGVLWANVGGSLIMGFLSEDRKLFQEEWGTKKERQDDEEKARDPNRRTPSIIQKHAAVKKTLPLYIGLATGFCGSFTSFSSFMRDSFFALSNALHVPISHPSSAPISETMNHAYFYGLASVGVGLSLMVVIVGSLQWTNGFKQPLCMS